MRVSIKLPGPLRKFYKEPSSRKREEAELADGATVGDLLEHYGVSLKSVSLVTINRQKADLQTRLSPGDEINVIPTALGG